MNDNVLEVNDLTISYSLANKKSFDAVTAANFSIAEGSTLALVGESGSGKSTLAAAINLLLPGNGKPTAGQILLQGEPLQDMGEIEMQKIRGAK
ncbi:MAG TPA: ATP-binding cassette domain-containing protein, partial [Microbacteriaceae bacterium]